MGHSKVFIRFNLFSYWYWNDFCKEFCNKLWKKNNTWNTCSVLRWDKRTSETAYYIIDWRILSCCQILTFSSSFNKLLICCLMSQRLEVTLHGCTIVQQKKRKCHSLKFWNISTIFEYHDWKYTTWIALIIRLEKWPVTKGKGL